MRLIGSFVSAAFLAAVMSSAATAQPAPTPAETPNACALLSRLDVAEGTRIPVGEGASRAVVGRFARCAFTDERGAEIAILVRRAPSADWVTEQLARMGRGVHLGTYRELPGIGDRSFLRQTPDGLALCLFSAGYYLQISLFRTPEASRMPSILEHLARIALTRLQTEYSPLTHTSNAANSCPRKTSP